MKVHTKILKAFGALLIAALLFGAMPTQAALAEASEANPALQAGGDRLAELQRVDGGWGWPLTYDEGVPSAPNIIGPIGKGLVEVYLHTGDPDHFAALQEVGAFLLAKTNTFSPSDGYLAAALDDIFGGTTYVDHVVTYFYDPLASGNYDRNGAGTLYSTASYVQLIRDARASLGNLAEWDIAIGLVGASACGAETSEWIAGLKAEVNEHDTTGDYDVLGLAGAIYGFAYVSEPFDPTSGDLESASSLADLAGILVSYQVGSGGFSYTSQNVSSGFEDIQTTAYAILALNELDRATYLTSILDAADYTLSVQLATGGWESEVGGGENNEVTAEAMWGISVAYPELWVCPTGDCGYPSVQYATIQGAIDAAVEGTTIYVMPGTYSEALILRTPEITLKSTDGADATIIDVPFGSLTVGVDILANMGTVTIDGFTVQNFTESGIVQRMSQREGTTFYVLNNKVLPFVPTDGTEPYLRNGVQVSGDGSIIKGNYVEGAYLTEDWASTGILIVNASDVLVENNRVSGSNYGMDYGIGVANWTGTNEMSNIQILGNTIIDADYPLDVTAYAGIIGSGVDIHENKVTGYIEPLWVGLNGGISVENVNAIHNWWGNIFGPQGPVTGDVDYSPWCGDAECTFFVPDEEIVLSGTITETVEINNPGVTVFLQNGTEIDAGGPCFVINADSTRIYTESPAGATCYPGSHGVEVYDGASNITIEGLEIDGTDSSTGDGIHFFGDITNAVISNNYIHNVKGDGIHFTKYPTPQTPVSFYVKGNLFQDNDGVGIWNESIVDEFENLLYVVDATYNAWGDFEGPTGADGDGVSANVTYEPSTHVKLYMESSGTPWADQVVNNQTITYTVKADLANVTGADFVLDYPETLLSVADLTLVTAEFKGIPTGAIVEGELELADVLSNDGEKITFAGETARTDYDAITSEGEVLFTVTFNAISAGEGTLDFVETSDVFAMLPDEGPSNNIYASVLVDNDVKVIDLPTLSTDISEKTFIAGLEENFNVTLTNPGTGGEFTNVRVNFTIDGMTVDDIVRLAYWDCEEEGGVTKCDWNDDIMLTLVDTATGVEGFFGQPAGFPMAAPYDITTNFLATLKTLGEYDFTFTLLDMLTDTELATTTGTAVVLGNFDVTGTIAMQGRTVRSGAPLTLTDVSLVPLYGPNNTTSTSELAYNVLFTGVNGGTYEITTLQPRYLNVTAELDKQISITGAYLMNALELRGGNAVWVDDNVINIQDASAVGSNYGSTGDLDADVNFDGKVSIQDLALVGGNFDLDSATAYAGWMP